MLKIFFISIFGIVTMSMSSGGNHKVKSPNTLPFLDVQLTVNKNNNRQTPFVDVHQEQDRRFFKNSKKVLDKKSGEHFDKATGFEFTEETYSGTNQVAISSGVKASADTKGKGKIIVKKIRRAKRANIHLCPYCTQNSCKNKCHIPEIVSHRPTLKCYCDDDCKFFNDCCKDFASFCRSNNISEANGNVSKPSSQIPTKTSSSGFQNLVNQENRNLWRCFAGHTGEVRESAKGIWMIGSCPTSWPRNEVYYRCLNLSLNNNITEDNYRYLPVYDNTSKVYHNSFCARCNGVDEKKLGMFVLLFNCIVTPPQDFSFEEKINFLFTHCVSGVVAWSAKEGLPRRYCRKWPAEVPAEFKPDHPANEINVNPITIMFDFDAHSPSVTVKPRCSDGQVFDHHLEECRATIQPLPSLSRQFDEYQILLWLKPSAYISCGDTMGKSRSHNDVKSQSLHELFIEDLYINTSILHTQSCTVEFILRVAGNKTEKYKTAVEKILNFKSPFNITINKKTFTVSKVTKRVLSCTNLQKYERHEYQVLQDGTSVAINETGEVFKVTDYYSNSTTPNLNQAIYVCRRRQMMNCSGVFILLSTNEFTRLPNRSLFVNASRQLYEWSEYILNTNGVEICRDVSQSQTNTPNTQDEILYMMTLVCMSLSITGLAFVLVTYSLFSELRTPPGINLMNLSVSILLAQLLWLLGSGQTDTPMACTVIAVILHYLFLVSFTWTSIIAVDTWRAFATKGRRPLADSRAERIKHCLRYMSIGWVGCLMYVIVCVVLDLTGTTVIGYQSSRACWMGSKLGMLYFFGIPVGTVLIINVVFYSMTLRLIHRHSQQARAASNRGIKQNFGVYVRIASLMGFTWVFGFAVPFGPQYLKVPFALLNCSQGVYIGIAFGCSKRTWQLYKKFCKTYRRRREEELEEEEEGRGEGGKGEGELGGEVEGEGEGEGIFHSD